MVRGNAKNTIATIGDTTFLSQLPLAKRKSWRHRYFSYCPEKVVDKWDEHDCQVLYVFTELITPSRRVSQTLIRLLFRNLFLEPC